MNLYIILILIALAGLVFLQIVIVWRRRRGISKKDENFIRLEWENIRKTCALDPKHAVINADKLFDFTLKKKGFSGSLGEKLKNHAMLFSRIQDVWSAHKLRNRIVHEIGFEITEKEAKMALSSFKQAIWDIGIRL